MQHRSLDELIEDAREILDEISSRVSSPIHSEEESCSDCDISTDDAGESRKTLSELIGESRKRLRFKPDENGMKPTNHGRAWSEKDIEMAEAFKLAGWSNAKIANHFQWLCAVCWKKRSFLPFVAVKNLAPRNRQKKGKGDMCSL